MVITIDRNEGIFRPDICDLINIKSQHTNDLISQLRVPAISKKENIRQVRITFKPVHHVVRASYQGFTLVNEINIEKCINSSIKIGDVFFLNLVFPEITARSYFEGGSVATFATFPAYFKIGTIDVVPDHDIIFRCPVEASKDGDVKKNQLRGYVMTIKIPRNSHDILMNGNIIHTDSNIAGYSFFINNI